MSTFDDTNRFSIWGNTERKDEKDREYQGIAKTTCSGCGVVSEHWVSAWKRKPGANPKAPALSGTIKLKEETHRAGMIEAKQAVEPAQEEFDDDIPF